MRRGRILILIGLILACGTAAVVYLLLQRVSSQPGGEQVPREDVVVAVQPIEEDQVVVEGQLEIKAMPKEAIPEDALRSTDGTAGMIAKKRISQGAIVAASDLQTKQEQMQEGKLGQLVEPGYVAVALPITELSSVSYGIIPDDRIDVLMTFSFVDIDQETQNVQTICPPLCPGPGGQDTVATLTGQIPRHVAQLILQDVRVLGVGRWTYGPPTPEEQAAQAQTRQAQQQPTQAEPPEYITLMLKAQDALVLKLAREYGASIDLAVRQSDDHQTWLTEQVTLEYLLTHYGFTVPNKLNYTMQKLAAPAETP